MKLLELHPQFTRWDQKNWPAPDGRRYTTEVPTIAEANGIIFICPECYRKKGNYTGVHSIQCWDATVPQNESLVGPGRWNLVGTTYHNLTLKGVTSDSVSLPDGCKAHFFVRDGEIIFV